MSYSPQALGLYFPTGAVYTWRSSALIVVQEGNLRFALASATLPMAASPSGSSPLVNNDVVPARQAYSHSASIGRRYRSRPPSEFVIQAQNAVASFQLTLTTG